jgi:hypothetical protein
MKAYRYVVARETDPESVGFVVGRFKHEKIGVTLKESNKLL